MTLCSIMTYMTDDTNYLSGYTTCFPNDIFVNLGRPLYRLYIDKYDSFKEKIKDDRNYLTKCFFFFLDIQKVHTWQTREISTITLHYKQLLLWHWCRVQVILKLSCSYVVNHNPIWEHEKLHSKPRDQTIEFYLRTKQFLSLVTKLLNLLFVKGQVIIDYCIS